MVRSKQVGLEIVGLAVALQLLAPSTARADRFDIVTFDAPVGWSRQAITDGLLFESSPAGTSSFCQMHLSKSSKAVATLPEELDRAWSSLLESQTLAAEADTPAQRDLGNGLTIAQRVAPVRAGDRMYITLLNLLRKDDRLVMVVVHVADLNAFYRCGSVIDAFIGGLKLDTAPPPQSDPQLAARFGNSVVGTWRYAFTVVNGITVSRKVIEIQFARDGTYKIGQSFFLGGSNVQFAETGVYRVEGQRIQMRPQQPGDKPASYALDWFFGDHPDYRGNWGLILRSSTDWLGGDKDDWRTFKPAE
jgi:hypothetical protein